MVLFDSPEMRMPGPWFPWSNDPVLSVPMKQP